MAGRIVQKRGQAPKVVVGGKRRVAPKPTVRVRVTFEGEEQLLELHELPLTLTIPFESSIEMWSHRYVGKEFLVIEVEPA